MKERNTAIDFLRFYFMLIIALWHFDFGGGLLKHGYLPVEFFFILSGYFIASAALKDPTMNVFVFTVRKLKRLYPEYLTVTLLFWGLFIASRLYGGKAIVWSNVFEGLFAEVTLTQQIGIFQGAINPSCWYISVLIIGGAFVFSLLRITRSSSVTLLFPLIILMVYASIFNNCETIECWDTYGPFHMPLWRGIAGMCCGCILFELLRKTCLRKNLLIILDVCAVLSFVIVSFILFIDSPLDALSVPLFCVVIADIMHPDGLLYKMFRGRFSRCAGSISYEMLLLNYPVYFVVKWLNSFVNIEYKFLIYVYVIVLLVSSVMLKIPFVFFNKSIGGLKGKSN